MVEPVPTPERWRRIDTLFHEALALTPAQRDLFLREACGPDEGLLLEVDRLLDQSGRDDGFLEPPDVATCSELPTDPSLDLAPGRRVGAFRLVRRIASGGMATVWLGERADDQFHQRVAVKLMSWGPVTSERRRRFELERQALAQLEHPYITRLIDGGTTQDGIPYLVMEYVEGLRFDEYCDQHRLSIVERLRLFQRFCEAVHIAHQNLIVHRDLKPNNMLVTADARPKLLDFGISKLLEEAPTDAAGDATLTFVRALTPRYASPEQMRGEPITTATDIYSLGVILYELLTGHRPYQVNGESTSHPHTQGWDRDPTPPSMVVASSEHIVAAPCTTGSTTATPELIGELRGEPVGNLRRRLRGDLDNVLLKALQQEPRRRYASVQQFSEDIDRFLQGLPVIARKGTLPYRFTKFVRRNKSAVAGVAAVIIALLAGVIGTSVRLREARTERDVALQVSEVLQGLLGEADLEHDADDESISKLLKDASQRMDGVLAPQPEVEASARYAIADALAGIHRFKDAKTHARTALTLYRALHGDTHTGVGDSLTLLGLSLAQLHDPQSVDIQTEAMALRTKLYGPNDPRVAENKVHLAFAHWYANKPPMWDVAEPLYLEAIETLRTHPESDQRVLAIALHSLAVMRFDRGRRRTELHVIERMLREAVELYRANPVRKDWELASSVQTLALIARLTGHPETEAAILDDYVSNTPRLFAHDRVSRQSAWRVASLMEGQGSPLEGLMRYRRALAEECNWRSRVCPVGTPEWIELFDRLSLVGGFDETAAQAQTVIATLPILDCPDNRALSERLVELSDYIGRYHDDAAADPLLRRCIAYQERQFPEDEMLHACARNALGAQLTRSGQFQKAKPLLTESYRVISSRFRAANPRMRTAIQRLVDYYLAVGKPNKAAHYRAMISALERTAPAGAAV